MRLKIWGPSDSKDGSVKQVAQNTGGEEWIAVPLDREVAYVDIWSGNLLLANVARVVVSLGDGVPTVCLTLKRSKGA